eukprot:Gb_33494 [translate_table: standard]
MESQGKQMSEAQLSRESKVEEMESVRSLPLKESFIFCKVMGTPPRESCVSEFSVSSECISPTYPHLMSPWNTALPSWSPSNSYSEFQPEGNFYTCITSMLKPSGHIFSLAVAAGRLLYIGSESKTIQVWSCSDFVEYSRFKSGSGTVRALLIIDDRIFSAHGDQKIRVWRRSLPNPTVHRRIATLPALKDQLEFFFKPNKHAKHSDVISSLAYTTTDGLLYSGSWDKTVKVWRMVDLKCIETIKAHEDAVNAIAVGHDGLLFTGSDDCTAKVWRRVVGRDMHALTMTLDTRSSPVKALALSPDGSVLYAGCSDGRINCWEKAQLSGQMHHAGSLRGHGHAVLCLATGSNLLFSGSADTTIRVWMMEVGVVHCCLAVLEGHRGPVKSIAASIEAENGCLVYSGSNDGTVKVWWSSASSQCP